MVELFARAPDGLKLAEGSHLTPIPLDEAVASLSAILLDEAYYAFIMAGRRETDGLPWVGEDRLIPLKAVAWLELTAPKEKGEKVDAKDVAQAPERRAASFATAGADNPYRDGPEDWRGPGAVPGRGCC